MPPGPPTHSSPAYGKVTEFRVRPQPGLEMPTVARRQTC